MNALFKALNDKTRRDILELLKSGDKTAGEIADHFQHTKPTISHHLDLLKQAELLTSEKKGQFIHYSIIQDHIANTLDGYLQEICLTRRHIRKESQKKAEMTKEPEE